MLALRQIAHNFVHLCFPPQCEACGDTAGHSRWICGRCADALTRIEQAPACECCAYPLALWGDPCPRCFGRGRRPFGSILRLGRYESPLRELIHALKYRGHWHLAQDLAIRLVERPGVAELLQQADALVPVPLHPWRRWQRGFNQSELLCGYLANAANKPVLPAIRRIRHTPTQTSLHSRTARLRNIRGAFALAAGASVEGKHLLLVDDVTTTGATLRYAGRALQQGGTRQLDALVLAVADPRGRNFEAT